MGRTFPPFINIDMNTFVNVMPPEKQFILTVYNAHQNNDSNELVFILIRNATIKYRPLANSGLIFTFGFFPESGGYLFFINANCLKWILFRNLHSGFTEKRQCSLPNKDHYIHIYYNYRLAISLGCIDSKMKSYLFSFEIRCFPMSQLPLNVKDGAVTQTPMVIRGSSIVDRKQFKLKTVLIDKHKNILQMHRRKNMYDVLNMYIIRSI
jgi:hypothetical protein